MLEADQIDSAILQEQDRETVSEESSNSHIASTEVVTNSDERNDSEISYFARASCSADLDKVCTSNVNDMFNSTNVETQIIYEDPKKWPANFRSYTILCKLVERGPQTIGLNSYKFPYTEDGRHFSQKWFFKILTNGKKVKRRWLLYSQSKDKMFCFPCLLFSKADKSPFSDFEKGFNDWKHLNPFIHVHETSSTHRHSYVEWKELEIPLKAGNSIDADIEKCIQAETEKWRCVLKCIVDVIIHCARNNLPLIGSSDAIGDNNCGVFLSTLELISHYNPQLFQHIENIKSKKHVPSYFSPKIQNEVIEILGNKVRSEILSKVKSAKYFSIIFDCTSDTAHIEQMSQIIRYINNKDGEYSVEDSFVDFVISHQKTGRNLLEEIMQKLSSDGLDIQNCCGQGFDNGRKI
ncbi:Zinc finger MYM-type protein 5 [Araneus ventricosus]|uniref:Zinc finger MYM-type protein 5 n=1 Tax=Araneus ventricosus TaxID=182803 RepID=A0A4Y2ELG8_ARAVE|nr:Zinc finger MYM-type protein 5 [Araneus ventricosus]